MKTTVKGHERSWRTLKGLGEFYQGIFFDRIVDYLGPHSDYTLLDTSMTTHETEIFRYLTKNLNLRVDRPVLRVPDLNGISRAEDRDEMVPNDEMVWDCRPGFLVNDGIVVCVDMPWDLPECSLGDLYETDCLKACGYEVVRLRMGGLERVPGAWNLTSSHESITDNLKLRLGLLILESMSNPGGVPYSMKDKRDHRMSHVAA